MEFKFVLSNKVKEFLNNSKLEEISIGCSLSQVIKIVRGEKIYFLKMMEEGGLTQEYQKLMWLEGKIPVPKVVLFVKENGSEYMITEGLDGEMLASSYYQEHMDEAIKVIKEAFIKFTEVNVLDCPFLMTNDVLLETARNNILNKLISFEGTSEWVQKRFSSLTDILHYLEENKWDEELTFAFGDLSLPNIFACKDKLVGFVDVGLCGVADKWLDIAIAQKSIRRNLGEEAVSRFYDALNIEPDEEKIDYYMLLLELMV